MIITNYQVGKWLQEVGLGMYSTRAEEEAVDGRQLLAMGDDELRERLKIAPALHRRKILTRLNLMTGGTPR